MDEVNDEEEEKDEEKKKQTGVSKYLEQTTLLICISRIASCMMGIQNVSLSVAACPRAEKEINVLAICIHIYLSIYVILLWCIARSGNIDTLSLYRQFT